MFLKLARYLIPHRLNLFRVPIDVLVNATTVQCQNIPLHRVYFTEYPRFNKFFNRLRHSSDNQILPEQGHCLTVHRAKLTSILKTRLDERHGHLIAQRP